MDDFPTKNRRRAWRRAMKAKVKTKARNIAKYVWHRDDEDAKLCEKLADHLAFCQKPCCNKPRSYEGDSLDEKRNAESFKEQLDEMKKDDDSKTHICGI